MRFTRLVQLLFSGGVLLAIAMSSTPLLGSAIDPLGTSFDEIHKALPEYPNHRAEEDSEWDETKGFHLCSLLLSGWLSTPKLVKGSPDDSLDPLLGRVLVPYPMSRADVQQYFQPIDLANFEDTSRLYRLLASNLVEAREFVRHYSTPFFFPLDYFDVRPNWFGMGAEALVDENRWYALVQKTYVHGLALTATHQDLRAEHFLAYLRVLKEAGLTNLREREVGVALRLKHRKEGSLTFWTLIGSRLKTTPATVPDALRFLPETVRDRVDEHYRTKLQLSDKVARIAKEISANAESRSLYFVVSPESFGREVDFWSEVDSHLNGNDKGKEAGARGDLTILGAATVVLSAHSNELLPLESLGDRLALDPSNSPFRIKRLKGKRLAELGRYIVTREGAREIGPKLVQEVTAALVGLGDVDQLIISVGIAGKRAWGDPLGFRVLHERVGYDGEPEYIMSADPRVVLKAFLKRDYPDEAFAAITGIP